VLEEYAAAARTENYASASNGYAEADYTFEKVRGGYEISIDKSFDGAGINGVDVSLSVSNIQFVPAVDDSFRVVIKGRSRYNKFRVENANGVLVVKAEEPIFKLEIFGFKSKLETTIYIPARFMGEIGAKSAAGNVSVTNVCGQLNFKTAAGNVSVMGHRGSSIRLRSAAGNANVELLDDIIDNIDISTAAGNTILVAKETRDLKISAAAGNINTKVTKLGGNSKFASSAGTVELTAYEVAGNIKISTSAGDARVYLPIDVNCRIDAKKPSIGSLHNELRGNANSPYVLKTSTSVGSVRLMALEKQGN